MVLHQSLLLPLLSIQQNKPRPDHEESSLEQKDTLHKGSVTHTEHDNGSDDDVSSTPWDGNSDDDMSNAPTGSVTHCRSRGQNLMQKVSSSCLRM